MADFTGNNWEGFMLDIQKTCSANANSEVEFEIVYHKLLQTFERKSSLFWHIRYFEQYITEYMNPKGLRVQVFPNIWSIDTEFKTRWEQNLLVCSKKMMELMVEYYMKELKVVDCEIKRIYDDNIITLNKEGFATYDARLKENIQSFTKELLVKKKEKLARDKMAFAGLYAYSWPVMNGPKIGRSNPGPFREKRRTVNNKDKTDCDSSTNSHVSQSSKTGERPTTRT